MKNSGTSIVATDKVGFLFPGQGSQYVGMGKDLFESSPEARSLFQEIDEALGFSLSKIMFEGPVEELTKTINTQPAILAMSLACLKSMRASMGENNMPTPNLVAGHSLGEYTALAAAGVLTAGDAVRLVRERGRLMQLASEERPGGMAAIIGLDEVVLEEVCRETGVQISNVNADDQIVIAGDRVALARAMDLASARGARRLIQLQVSGAFHTRLMEPAASGITEALHNVDLKDPEVPIIANSTGRPITTSRGIRTELVRQLCSCVQWKRSISYMVQSGVGTFYEIGPGKILAALTNRNYAEIPVVSLGGWDAINGLTR